MSYTTRPLIDNMVSLKVENLSYTIRAQDLKRVFRVYGEIGDIHIPRFKNSRDSRGYAFVRYYDKRDAYDAIHNLNHTIIDGRMISVKIARYERPVSPTNDGYRRQRSPRRSRPSSRRMNDSSSRSRDSRSRSYSNSSSSSHSDN